MTTNRRKPAKSTLAPGAPLSSDELDELKALMKSRHPNGPFGGSPTRLHGFFASVVSGPMIMPSEWMPILFGGPDELAWKDIDQARRATDLVMRFYNDVAGKLFAGGDLFRAMLEPVGDSTRDQVFGGDWCQGYILGVMLRDDEWKLALKDPTIFVFMDPIVAVASPEKAVRIGNEPERPPKEMRADVLSASARALYKWWRSRPKMSR